MIKQNQSLLLVSFIIMYYAVFGAYYFAVAGINGLLFCLITVPLGAVLGILASEHHNKK